MGKVAVPRQTLGLELRDPVLQAHVPHTTPHSLLGPQGLVWTGQRPILPCPPTCGHLGLPPPPGSSYLPFLPGGQDAYGLLGDRCPGPE